MKKFTIQIGLFCLLSFSAQSQELDEIRAIVSDLVDVHSDFSTRAPLLFWHGNNYDYSEKDLKVFAQKGLLPALPIITTDVEKARLYKELELPLYLLEGQGSGTWPYRMQADYARMYSNDGTEYPSIFDLRGWSAMSDYLRQSFSRYKETGAEVAGVIFDFELFPRGQKLARFSNSPVLQAQLANPTKEYSDEEYDFFLHDYESALHSAYLAAPARETFPSALLTNWGVYCNSAQDPVMNKTDISVRNQSIGLFNASNTFAYAWDNALRFHRPNANRQLDDDAIYFWSMLKQTSEDGRNQQKYCPMMRTTTWVSAYVRDDHSQSMEPMDRRLYQNALLHLWFRGVDAMFVFNPFRQERPEMWKRDLVDTAWVYKEVDPYWTALQRGRILNQNLSDIASFEKVWSGVEHQGEYTIITTCFSYSCVFTIPLNGEGLRELQSQKGTFIHQFYFSP